jgi:hypothetical protein
VRGAAAAGLRAVLTNSPCGLRQLRSVLAPARRRASHTPGTGTISNAESAAIRKT